MIRIQQLGQQFNATKSTLTIQDSRSGKKYEIPISNNFIKASDLEKIKDENGSIIRSYDPGYMNTVNCTSKISFIDGDNGILEYRGYPIEQLAEKSTYLEVAFLLIYGELPTPLQYDKWCKKIQTHTFVHQDLYGLLSQFRYDAHPMGMVISSLSAVSTLHPEANPALSGQNIYADQKSRNKQIHRMIGSITTITALAYRNRIGRQPNQPHQQLGYVDNFLYMMDRLNESNYTPHPTITKVLDILFILHAEHELNCSTSAVRHLTSSGVDIYTAIAGAAAALYGPKHGGANEAVLRMLEKIGSKQNIPQFIENVKNKKALLFGFGHRVYKSYDPRAKIVKQLAYQVFDLVGKDPLIEIALELENIALNDKYFKDRSLYPNVDFYTGIIYKALGFPTDMFPLLFAIPRISGWLAHWCEFLDDPENKIVRPRQNYQGYKTRDYVPIDQRKQTDAYIHAPSTSFSTRRNVSVKK
ncbi:unnamed protein product [Paramecium primaurelia]|uniref:Citrate synthase n=1 Tax=Paramecium primaurelia TaxID=5886 RepID=A0A8S1PM73_PARPR|nr:unnamed protein product [Paramecium primaurelia]